VSLLQIQIPNTRIKTKVGGGLLKKKKAMQSAKTLQKVLLVFIYHSHPTRWPFFIFTI
jgi:hypothetical protein